MVNSVAKVDAFSSPIIVPLEAERMVESTYPGSTPVVHWKSTLADGTLTWIDPSRGILTSNGMPLNDPSVHFALLERMSQFGSLLDSSKLATNTGLNIIQSLAELSETLEIFTRKFWRLSTRSYGAYEWGLRPLIGEIKSILTMIANLEKLLSTGHYESVNNPTIADFKIIKGNINVFSFSNIKCSIRQTGNVNYDDLGAAKWLDALGFYPDLATAWDLVPLSFMVNWFVPVGSYLESFRQPWITHIPFQGWVTAKASYTVEHSVLATSSFRAGVYYTVDGSIFSRGYRTEILVVPERGQPASFDMPSLGEIFKTIYLTGPRAMRGLRGDDTVIPARTSRRR